MGRGCAGGGHHPTEILRFMERARHKEHEQNLHKLGGLKGNIMYGNGKLCPVTQLPRDQYRRQKTEARDSVPPVISPQLSGGFADDPRNQERKPRRQHRQLKLSGSPVKRQPRKHHKAHAQKYQQIVVQQMIRTGIDHMLKRQKHREKHHLRPAEISDLFIPGIQIQNQVRHQMHAEQKKILLPQRSSLFLSGFSHQLKTGQRI